jgi:hypothetical protein
MGTHGHTNNTITLMNTRVTAPATRNGRGCHCNGAFRVDDGSCCRSSRLVDRNVSMAPYRRTHSLVALACPRSRVCFGSRQRDAGRHFPTCRGREYSARPVPFARRHLLCAVSHVHTLVSSRHCVSRACLCSRLGVLLSMLPLCAHSRSHSHLVIAFPTRRRGRPGARVVETLLCMHLRVHPCLATHVGDQVHESSTQLVLSTQRFLLAWFNLLLPFWSDLLTTTVAAWQVLDTRIKWGVAVVAAVTYVLCTVLPSSSLATRTVRHSDVDSLWQGIWLAVG